MTPETEETEETEMFETRSIATGKAIPPSEVVDLLNDASWYVNGGTGAKDKSLHVLIKSAALLEGVLFIFAGETMIPQYRLVMGDVVIRDSRFPHILQVNRFSSQKCQRSEADGGGWHTRMLPTVYLSLYNKTLKERQEAAERAKVAAQEEGARQTKERLLTDLNLVGAVIIEVEQTLFGHGVLKLQDGRVLALVGRLEDLRIY